MDDKLDSSKVSPPQSIIIQAANPDNVNDTSNAATFPSAQRKRNKSGFKKANQVIDKSKKKKNQVIDKSKKKKQLIDKSKKKKQGIISVDEGPSGELLVSSLLMIIISTVGFFFIDTGFIADDFMCCLVCNGNSIGLVLLGTYSAQYGKWKKSSEANASALFSNLISAVAFIVAVIFVILWLMFVTY
ncbi:MAG: hypothetical protein ACKVKS_06570 [Candidatus Poseidoniales archaeon]